MAFVIVALIILQLRPHKKHPTGLRENLTESFISSLRYARNSRRMKIILFRNIIFSLVISIVPALLPVIALKEMECSAAQLGLVFTSVATGSLAGAVICTPLCQTANLCECNHFDCDGDRGRRGARYGVHSPSARFDGVRGTCRLGLGACGIRDLGGWTTGDAWVGTRKDERVSDNARTGQHGSWRSFLGNGSAHAGLSVTLAAGAAIALVVLAFGHRLSINFAAGASVEASPLNHLHDLRKVPEADDGPIRITIEYAIAKEH